MFRINGFRMSLLSAAVVSGIVDGFVPESDGKGTKKYLRWLIALVILLTLLSPLKSLVASIPGFVDKATGSFDYSSVEAMGRVNSLIALHIRDAVAGRFGLDKDGMSAELCDGSVKLTLERPFWLIKSDISDYIEANFGIGCEVIFIE